MRTRPKFLSSPSGTCAKESNGCSRHKEAGQELVRSPEHTEGSSGRGWRQGGKGLRLKKTTPREGEPKEPRTLGHRLKRSFQAPFVIQLETGAVRDRQANHNTGTQT